LTDRALAERLFAGLREASFDGVGITRESYGPGEDRALDLIERTARDAGLAVARDAAANLVVTLAGTDRSLPAIACGSHLDSVPQGGNFDGAAGVVAGLLALIALSDGPPARHDLVLFGLRGEESAWFGRPYLGSSALLGALSAADLKATHYRSGKSLAERMDLVGVDVDRVRRRERLLAPANVGAFLELHIEQGPVLVARDLPLAIVTGIRGNIRHRGIVCRGEAGHSGAVPRWLRHDAVFAVADLIGRLDGHWQSMLAKGQDVVVTAGIFATDAEEHAVTRIPGLVRFSFEVRSEDQATLDGFYALLQEDCRIIGEERGVSFEFDRKIDSEPARMDPALVARLAAAAARLGLPAERIASGAGHDSAVFANAGIPSAMIFVRNQNGSHNPREAMEMDDFLAGADLLRVTLRDLAA
jgi:N-carbamoyl-L-amino-acid hydrolase